MQIDFADTGARTEAEKAPAGICKLKFLGISDEIELPNRFKQSDDDPDTKVMHVANFVVPEGEDHEGKEVNFWFSAVKGIPPKSNKRKLIGWLLGGPIPTDGSLNTNDLVGVVGQGVIEATDHGGTKLVGFQPELTEEF